MKKNIIKVCMVFMMMFLLVGCTTKKIVTFEVQTGDKIKVELNTKDKYDITVNVPFSIMKEEQTLSDGTFITLDGYQSYLNSINSDSAAAIIDSGEKNGVTYTFYSYNNKEFNYLIKVNNSSTAILLGNSHSEEEAKECFERLTFSKE